MPLLKQGHFYFKTRQNLPNKLVLLEYHIVFYMLIH